MNLQAQRPEGQPAAGGLTCPVPCGVAPCPAELGHFKPEAMARCPYRQTSTASLQGKSSLGMSHKVTNCRDPGKMHQLKQDTAPRHYWHSNIGGNCKGHPQELLLSISR